MRFRWAFHFSMLFGWPPLEVMGSLNSMGPGIIVPPAPPLGGPGFTNSLRKYEKDLLQNIMYWKRFLAAQRLILYINIKIYTSTTQPQDHHRSKPHPNRLPWRHLQPWHWKILAIQKTGKSTPLYQHQIQSSPSDQKTATTYDYLKNSAKLLRHKRIPKG